MHTPNARTSWLGRIREPLSESGIDRALLALRIVYSTMLFAFHGLHKTVDGLAWARGEAPAWPLANEVAAVGFPAPVANAAFATAVQFLAPLFLIPGFWARPAALLLSGTLAGAVYTNVVLAKDNQLALLYLLLAVFFVITGAGRLSLDGRRH